MSYYQIWTDGACSQNGDWIGGWGYALIEDVDDTETIHEACGGARDTTNNRMEMMAAIEGMKFVAKEIELAWGDEVELYSDSAYVVNCIVKEWYVKWRDNGWTKKGGLKNAELWKELIECYEWFEKNGFYINFHKVKGHSGVKWNEYADRLAVRGGEEIRKEG